MYQSKNKFCGNGKAGYIYKLSKDKLYRASCNHFSCMSCRKSLKKDLHDRVCQQVDSHELNYHMIITFPGKQAREKIPYYQSYPIMNYDYKKLAMVIKYKYPDFKYIKFPRAQANPIKGNPAGYCHFHVIHNTKINKNWLDNKCKKYTLGYTFLRFNEDVAGYLHNDFYIDDEWTIPLTLKHYSSSRNIIINSGQGYALDPDTIYYTSNASFEFIEKDILDKYGRLLPHEEYLKKFTQIIGS